MIVLIHHFLDDCTVVATFDDESAARDFAAKIEFAAADDFTGYWGYVTCPHNTENVDCTVDRLFRWQNPINY